MADTCMDALRRTQAASPAFDVGSFAERIAAIAPWPIEAERLPGALRRLVDGAPDLPRPGQGRTLQRWRALAAVAAADLALLKLYEGHTDARAILEELRVAAAPGTWGVWAADPPDAVAIFRGNGSEGRLDGRKAWCSGAGLLDHALVTARTPAGARVLVQLALKQPGIHADHTRWNAVGMAATRTGEVAFERVRAAQVGAPGAYLARSGFWHGAIGIAAAWHGAACAVAMMLRRSARLDRDPHAKAHLGAIDANLFSARCVLEEAARDIDAAPTADVRALALRVRAVVEAAAGNTLERVGRALGATPLCRDAAHAQRCADLVIFLRQSHAESDLEALAEHVMHDAATDPW